MIKRNSNGIGRTNRTPVDYDYNYALRNARVESGYSGEDLGNMVGLTPASICHYERLRHLPSKKVQKRLAKALGKEVSELFPEELSEYVRQTSEQREGYRKRKKTRKRVNFRPLEQEKESLFYLEDFEQTIYHEELEQGVERLLATLPERTRECLKLRYGSYGRKYTYREIGEIYNVSRAYVHELVEKTIYRLRKTPEACSLKKFLEDDFNGGIK